MSDTVYLNTGIFNSHVKNHFTNYVQTENSEQPIHFCVIDKEAIHLYA